MTKFIQMTCFKVVLCNHVSNSYDTNENVRYNHLYGMIKVLLICLLIQIINLTPIHKTLERIQITPLFRSVIFIRDNSLHIDGFTFEILNHTASTRLFDVCRKGPLANTPTHKIPRWMMSKWDGNQVQLLPSNIKPKCIGRERKKEILLTSVVQDIDVTCRHGMPLTKHTNLVGQ
jgi:hypothetical protein